MVESMIEKGAGMRIEIRIALVGDLPAGTEMGRDDRVEIQILDINPSPAIVPTHLAMT